MIFMKKIEVEGYGVVVERAGDKYIASVPELPGCTVQIDRKEDAPRAISKMIGLYLLELASKKPRRRRNGPDEGGNNSGRGARGIRRP